jgi:hypothetical protein
MLKTPPPLRMATRSPNALLGRSGATAPRPRSGAGVGLPLLLAGTLLQGMAGSVNAAQDPPPPDSRAPRPAGLVILLRTESVLGSRQIGVFDARSDPRQPGLWSVQVWEETRDRVTISTDRIGCTTTAPLRITGTGRQLLVRQLNPGGAIHDASRLDHLIWWAVCHPELAGRDPAGLRAEARRLGFDGRLREQQDVVLAPSQGAP